MFQLVCDPSGAVVDTSLKQLVPAVIKWGNKLDQILRVLLSHILSSVQVYLLLTYTLLVNGKSMFSVVNLILCDTKMQHCPPLSGVEGSVESYFHVFGERERWNIDVLLRLLTEVLPSMHEKAVETCPFSSVSETSGTLFSTSVLELYAG